MPAACGPTDDQGPPEGGGRASRSGSDLLAFRRSRVLLLGPLRQYWSGVGCGMDDQKVDQGLTATRPSGGRSHTPKQGFAVVGICLAILIVAYGLFSSWIVNGSADAAGGRPNTSFDALWFANPSIASHPIPRGTEVDVAVSNQSRGAQRLHWSTSSSGATLQSGSIDVPAGSTRTFVVQTQQARPDQWFSVGLVGTSIVIRSMIS